MTRKSTYILTCDLADRFKQFSHLKINLPDIDGFFSDFDATLANLIQNAHPDCDLKVFSMKDIADQVLRVAIKKQSETKGLIVSTNIDLAAPRRGHVIETNRLINDKGEIIGIGPRPGHPALSQQYDTVAKMAERRPIIIVEDGLFSGSTLKALITGLKKANVDTAMVIVGFAFPNGYRELSSVFSGEIIAINELGGLIDWMPDHDFFPFAPNCGKVLGVKMNNHYEPFYNHNGVSYCVPYIMPFGPMEEWASIPKDHCFEMSYFCMDKAVEFFSMIHQLNGQDLTIKDVIGINPRVSAPVAVNPTHFPAIHDKIGSFLHGVHSESW